VRPASDAAAVPARPVGRAAELDRLEEALAGVARGAPVRMVVEGEPGIGKTHLLSELRRQGGERGHLVLAGAASEFERDLPFGVFVEALDAHVAARDAVREGWAEEDWFADLAGVLPGVRGRSDHAPAGADERHRAHGAVRRLLQMLAQRRPLVLVLDDLHWADPASVELIAALVRRDVAAPVLLALSHRSGRAPPKLAAALGDPDVLVIELAGLGEVDCARLTGGLSPEQGAAIFEASGGNPFYALQLARGMPSDGRSAAAPDTGGGVPRAVAASLLDEFAALSAAARRLLDAAAIAGDPFEPDLAFAIAELPVDTATAALDELLDCRLLHGTTVPRRFAFRHPLVRRAVYDATGGGWRIAAHARAAAALAAAGASAVARAHHVEHSAAPGDDDAIALLLQAADDSAARAPAGAARWYEAALRLIPAADRARRLRTLIGSAQVLAAVGALDRSAARLVEAIELVPAQNVVLQLRLASSCAACENFLGDHPRARRRLSAAVDALGDGASREAVTARLDLAAGAFFTFERQRMNDLTGAALRMARTLEQRDLVGAAAAALAHAAALDGDVAQAQAGADEAGRELDELDDDVLAEHLDAVNRLAWSEFLIERHEASIRHAQRGVAVARAAGRNRFVPLILQAQALSTMMLGHLAAAAELQEDALEIAALAANGYVTCSVLTTSGGVAMQRGDHDGALRAGRGSVRLVEGSGGRIPGMARARLAVTRRELGASAEETASLVAGIGGWAMTSIPPTWRVLWADALTRAELAAGRRDCADACARLAEEAAAGFALPLAAALAQRARARVLLASGDNGAAREVALASAAAAARGGAAIESARAEAIAGQAAAADADRDTAVTLLRNAESCFDECGADADRGAARRELRKLGARAEPRGPSGDGVGGVDALSRREREVAGLITARKTNREVAAELFLSEKTVESHLRNIFAKLGASSRVDVARAIERARDQRPGRP
jgi:DNA-binding NarL/FixJ family response regulator